MNKLNKTLDEIRKNNLGVIITDLNKNFIYYQDNLLKKLDITFKQGWLLNIIKNNENITQDDISSFLDVDKASITRRLKRLESKELIMKKPNPEFRRQKLIYLSEKGENILEQFLKEDEKFNKNMENILKKDNYHELLNEMNLLNEKLIEMNEP